MAYVAILILLAILSTLGFAFLFKVGTMTSATMTRGKGMQAHYLAESAANHAMWRLLNEITFDVERRVSHDDDDAEEKDTGQTELGGNELELGKRLYVGARFLNVGIPQGATIINASVEFTAQDDGDVHTDVTIFGENTDDASGFTSCDNDISTRPQTVASVTWHEIPPWTKDQHYRSPGLAPIVQEIVDRPGWASGNDMVILFRSDDLNGNRRAISHDNTPANAPLLYVEYGDASITRPGIYYMHSLAGGRYGYKVRRHTDTTFATIATVGAVGDNVVNQSYVLQVLPDCESGNFRDEFSNVAYNNNDGSLDWAGDWIEFDDSGSGPSIGKAVITGGELRLNGPVTTISAWPSGKTTYFPSLIREVGLSRHVSAILSFSFRTGGGVDAGEDSAVVEVSGDDGGSWTVLEDFIDAGPSAFGTRSYYITKYIASDTQVRFRINANYGGTDEYFYVDDVEIAAFCDNQPPIVDAGPDQILCTLAEKVFLDGTMTDDGLPNPPATVTTTWSMVSGPGKVIFDDTSAIDTVAVFSELGTYVLRLTADDGELDAYDEITISVGNPGYTEMYEIWSPADEGSWRVVDLSVAPYNVPADAVLEVAITNSNIKIEWRCGVRALGSSLGRLFQLHEAEGGGVDVVVMHVQANSNSQIEYFAENREDIEFILLGYWACASYVETFDNFKAGASNSWQNHNLSTYGVGPGQVAEVVVANTSDSWERSGGVRTDGSSFQRRLIFHEAESGGVDAAPTLVKAGSNASATVELWAEADGDVDFYLVGYWSTPPGTYTETAKILGKPSADQTWEKLDLSAFGVPGNAVVQITMANGYAFSKNRQGLRENGSSLNRTIDLHEAEAGGADLATLHVNADENSTIQWYHEDISENHQFFLMGYWE